MLIDLITIHRYAIQSYSSANIKPWTLVTFRSCFAECLYKNQEYLKASTYFLAVANTHGCADKLTTDLVVTSLEKAIVAAFLAASNRQRVRLLPCAIV